MDGEAVRAGGIVREVEGEAELEPLPLEEGQARPGSEGYVPRGDGVEQGDRLDRLARFPGLHRLGDLAREALELGEVNR